MYHKKICDTIHSDTELSYLANMGKMPKEAVKTLQSEYVIQKECINSNLLSFCCWGWSV